MNEYDDIINLPHYEPKHHSRMSMMARAAQFAPFAALSGHETAIDETARLTDEQIELDESSIDELNRKLACLRLHINERPRIRITYFQPDERKAGGAYLKHSGVVKDIDIYRGMIIFEDEHAIPLHFVLSMGGKLFDEYFSQ